MRTLLLTLALLSGLLLQAQEKPDSSCRVSGTVYLEGEHTALLRGAHVRLYFGKDSLLTTTTSRGDFLFRDVPVGPARLRVTHLSCRPYEGAVELVPGQNVLLVSMEEKPLEVAAAYARAEAEPVTHRGDTIVYNAAAVRTMEGDYAIEILRQMPGVEIRDGFIYVGGEPVRRTYVNGRLIFGDAPMAALTALRAEDVTIIKSYEELSVEDRRRGMRNARKEKVLDVQTRSPIVNAVDVHAIAGIGADGSPDAEGRIQPRYTAGATANFFSEDFLAWGDVNFNNIGRSYNRLDRGLPLHSLGSYSETAIAGAGVGKYWGDRLLGSNAGAEYTFSKDYARSFARSITDYLALPGSPARREADTTLLSGVDYRHSLRTYLSLHNDSIKDLESCLDLSFSHSASTGGDYLHRDVEGEPVRLQRETNHTSLRDFEGRFRTFWSDNTAGRRFFPRVGLEGRLKRSGGTRLTLDTLQTAFNRRSLTSENSIRGGGVSLTAGLSRMGANDGNRTFSWDVYAGAGYDTDTRLQYTLDILNPVEPVPYMASSFDYTWSYLSASLGNQLTYATPKFSFVLYHGLRWSHQVDNERLPAAAFARDYLTYSANGNVKSGKWLVTFRVSPLLPSLEQTRPWVDDRNPLALRSGNSDLRPSETMYVSASWSNPRMGKYSTLSMRASLETTFRPIVQRTKYFAEATPLQGLSVPYTAPAGSSLTTYANGDMGLFGPGQLSSPAAGNQVNDGIGSLYSRPALFAVCRRRAGRGLFLGASLAGQTGFRAHTFLQGKYRADRGLDAGVKRRRTAALR